jgi:hypothetical protein
LQRSASRGSMAGGWFQGKCLMLLLRRCPHRRFRRGGQRRGRTHCAIPLEGNTPRT